MNETLLAFGRGCVKVLISLFFGSGVGLFTFGMTTRNKPEIYQQALPPAELYLAFGAGLLTAGVLMTVLFLLPAIRGRPVATGKGAPYAELPS